MPDFSIQNKAHQQSAACAGSIQVENTAESFGRRLVEKLPDSITNKFIQTNFSLDELENLAEKFFSKDVKMREIGEITVNIDTLRLDISDESFAQGAITSEALNEFYNLSMNLDKRAGFLEAFERLEEQGSTLELSSYSKAVRRNIINNWPALHSKSGIVLNLASGKVSFSNLQNKEQVPDFKIFQTIKNVLFASFEQSNKLLQDQVCKTLANLEIFIANNSSSNQVIELKQCIIDRLKANKKLEKHPDIGASICRIIVFKELWEENKEEALDALIVKSAMPKNDHRKIKDILAKHQNSITEECQKELRDKFEPNIQFYILMKALGDVLSSSSLTKIDEDYGEKIIEWVDEKVAESSQTKEDIFQGILSELVKPKVDE